MTTKITITNENPGEPYASWDVAVVNPVGVTEVLKPGEKKEVWLWHDGRQFTVYEIPK